MAKSLLRGCVICMRYSLRHKKYILIGVVFLTYVLYLRLLLNARQAGDALPEVFSTGAALFLCTFWDTKELVVLLW